MFTLYMEVVNSSQSVGFTKCRIIPSIYWMTHVTMKFQDASCPPLAVSVLSSSVEPPSQLQSLALSMSSSLDVTVMTRRSTWSWVGAL